MKDPIKLSDAEWKIMRLLWHKPHTITQLVSALREDTGWSKSTVITMLGRMEQKGAVSYREGARARLYHALCSREEAAAEETASFLERVYQGSVGLLVSTLVDRHALSQEEVEELYAILKKAEEEQT